MIRTKCLVGLIVASVATGCGSSAPTSPSTPSTGPKPTENTPANPPTAFAVDAFETPSHFVSQIGFAEQPLEFTWSPVPGATSYVLEIGAVIGGSDVLKAETSATKYSWSKPPLGDVFAQVSAKNNAGSGPKTPFIGLTLISFPDYIEALFLGSGPSAESPQRGCPSNGILSTWPEGSNVSVVISDKLTGGQSAGVTAVANQATDATLGAVRATIRSTSESNPVPNVNEIVTVIGDIGKLCPGGAVACSQTQLAGRVIQRATIFLPPADASSVAGHETGHAFGFCHLTGAASIVSVMADFSFKNEGLSRPDLLASQAVYRAGLHAGANRADFVAAGLLR